MEILQNLYNLSQPYPRKHSPLVSKKASAQKEAMHLKWGRALRGGDSNKVIYEKGGKVSAFKEDKAAHTLITVSCRMTNCG